jgi:cobalt-zinc-cadmium efflux system membrane fusion protein
MLPALALLGVAAAPHPGHEGGPSGVVAMTADQQKTVGLQFANAAERPITEPVHVPGSVAFAEDHISLLRSLAPARVLRLLVEPGTLVRRGDLLALLEIPSLLDAEQQRAGAEAELRQASAGVAVARAALSRGVALAADGSLARAEAARRRYALAEAVAARDVAVAKRAMLEAQIVRLHPVTGPDAGPGVGALVAPISGTVARVGIEPGSFIESSADAFLVADLSEVVVRAQVPEEAVPLVRVGDPAEIRMASGGARVWRGTVAGLDAALDPGARTLAARILLANQDGALRAGMFTDVTLTSDRGRNDVVVPAESVQLVGNRHVAFMPLGNGRFQSHDLTLGVQLPDGVEVRSGLKPGDTVVTRGSFELKALLQQDLLGGSG